MNARATRNKWKAANPEKVRVAKRRWAAKHYKKNSLAESLYKQIRWLAFPEELRRIKRDARTRNRDRYLLSERRWKSENTESVRGYKRDYHVGHRQSCLNRAKKWCRKFPDRIRVHKRKYKSKRRAIEMLAPIVDSRAILEIYTRARHLRRWFDVAVDHVIPLAKGGSHSADNLQIIYRSENLRKGASLNYQPRIIFS